MAIRSSTYNTLPSPMIFTLLFFHLLTIGIHLKKNVILVLCKSFFHPVQVTIDFIINVYKIFNILLILIKHINSKTHRYNGLVIVNFTFLLKFNINSH